MVLVVVNTHANVGESERVNAFVMNGTENGT